MTGQETIAELTPNEIVKHSLLAQYTKHMGAFSDDLTIAHTNLSVLRQMREFDEELFGAPVALMTLLRINLIDQILLILARLWKDKTRGTVRLDKFSDWLMNSAVVPEHRGAVAAALAQAWPSQETCETIERCRKIRHARLAHQRGTLPLHGGLVPVGLDEIEGAARALGTLYGAMNFGTSQDLVFVEFQAREGEGHVRGQIFILGVFRKPGGQICAFHYGDFRVGPSFLNPDRSGADPGSCGRAGVSVTQYETLGLRASPRPLRGSGLGLRRHEPFPVSCRVSARLRGWPSPRPVGRRGARSTCRPGRDYPVQEWSSGRLFFGGTCRGIGRDV